MAVHPARPDPTAQVGPTLIPISTRQRRLRLLDGVIEAGCEAIAHGAAALRSLVESRAHDARADLHVRAIDAIAARMAAEACELGDTVTFNRAAAIRRHCAGYAHHDGAEDSLVGTAHKAIDRLCVIVRGVNRRLTAELAKRGGRR